MLPWLAWFAAVSGASAFLGPPHIRCDLGFAAVRPAITTRSTPVAFGPQSGREEVVQLNVGGTLFSTRLDTLLAVPGSVLASDVENWSVQDRKAGVFYDKDPEAFAWVLGFLRNGCRLLAMPPEHLLEQVREDARYFGIHELISALDEKIAQAQAPQAYEYKHHWHPNFWGRPGSLGNENQGEQIDASFEKLESYSEAGWRLAHVYPAGDGTSCAYVECILERALPPRTPQSPPARLGKDKESWDVLLMEERAAAEKLGWTPESWEHGDPPVCSSAWETLDAEQRAGPIPHPRG